MKSHAYDRLITQHGFSGFLQIGNLILRAVLCIASGIAYAADTQPVERVIDDSKVMSRVQLVGVIADGSAKNAGIAVIKDTETGRSYAIRTGDSLPGVDHIVLTNVQRDGLEFKSAEQKFVVRPFINTDMSNASDAVAERKPEEAGQPADAQEGPGLFEKWASGGAEQDVDRISLEAIKVLKKKYESLNQEDDAKDAMRATNAPSELNKSSGESDDEVIYEEDIPEDI
jgi:hypothetical protein